MQGWSLIVGGVSHTALMSGVKAASLAALASLAGCGFRSDPLAARQHDRLESVGIEAFVGPVTEPDQATRQRVRRSPAAAEPVPFAVAGGSGDDDGSAAAAGYEAAGFGGGPSLFAGDLSLATSQPVLIDSKIGDINGLPIFADEFLEPLSGQLQAEARRLSRQEWLGFTNDIIINELNDIVLDELLRAEALARLTPEQQVGFRGFLEAIRQDLLSQNYGSRQIAGRRLEERAGLTEDEFIEQQRQTQLIQATLRDQIGNRVSVSWRDIVQRYQRDIDVFKPDPAALYRIIRVRDDDVEEVKRRLAAGEPFEEIAAEPFNSFERETQGQRRVTFSGERGEADLFGGPLNEIAQQLELGEVSEPLVIGSSTYWMRLEGVQAEEISLYDAQLEIAGLIESERTQEELNRFIQRMVERADIGTLDSIRRGLLVIAAERFAPPPGPPGGSSAGSPRGR